MKDTFRPLILGLILVFTPSAGPIKQAHSAVPIQTTRINKASPLAGSYSVTPAEGSGLGIRVTLHLKPDGSVRFIHDFFSNDPIEEKGVWKENSDRTATVTLTGLDSGRLYDKPDVITFRLVNDYLVAIKYDYFVHGYRGLRLKRTTWRKSYRSEANGQAQ